LHAINPRLVVARISGYGQDGPYRDKPAFGAIGDGLLSALWQRDVAGTGRGRVVDVNLVDSVFSLME
jgi:crotonobetainyl-CoA:carnitine CoA-transferase CaiB-like acyl-CoA transferase